MFNNRGKLLSSSKPEESAQNSWPYGRRQELVKRWFGRESPLTDLSEGKPKPGLVKQLHTLISKHIIKSGDEKDKNLYLPVNNSPSRKDQQAASGRINRVGCRCSAAHDIRAANTLGGISGIYDEL